ncbi:MAG TPA: hypothetical protein VGB98_18025 [Pyrinomonadaceae bacterium]|jgi:hypothetical protein
MRRSDGQERRPDIELHIEELVLEGFAPHEREHIAAAVELELARLLAERGAPALLARGGEIARLDGGAFQTAPRAKADSTGEQIAQAVYGGFDTKCR